MPENGKKRVDYIPGVSPTRLADVPLNDGSYRSKQTLEMFLKGFSWLHKAHYLLFTSIYELEPEAIDVLKGELSLPIYTTGPATPPPYFSLEKSTTLCTEVTTTSHAQPVGSVLYISQGSFFSVSTAQINEIAVALRESKVRFLWVARGEALRLEEICDNNNNNMGLVLAWCDQLRVLCHPAIGGFWSHCGWNSTKEGVLAGVPFLTFPIILDQAMDSKMIVEDWRVGWRVKEDVNDDDFVKKDEIVKLLQKFMDLDSNSAAREIRERAIMLKHVCRNAIQIGGSAEIDLNAFITEIYKYGNA